MAGFIVDRGLGNSAEFHIDTPNIVEKIHHGTNNARVVTLQLDGDELKAALWGLENYRKGPEIQTRDNDGSLWYWPKIADAMEIAKNDSSIWKISWTDASTGERVRLVRRIVQNEPDVWVYEPIDFPGIPTDW